MVEEYEKNETSEFQKGNNLESAQKDVLSSSGTTSVRLSKRATVTISHI